MPIYEYRCNSCGYQFELLRSFSDADEMVCPRCDQPTQRLLSAGTGIVIKGGKSSIARESNRAGENCERTTPCCGREIPCENPPCGKQ